MDYMAGMYRPVRGPEFQAERRTTYGQTIAASYHMHASQKNDPKPPTEKIKPVFRRQGSRMLSRRSWDQIIQPVSPSSSLDSTQKLYKSNRIRGLESRVPLVRDTKSRSKYAVTSISSNHPEGDESKLRLGRAGGVWRHVREVLQGRGDRIMFVDGQATLEDRIKNLPLRLEPLERSFSQPDPVVSSQLRQAGGKRRPLTLAEVQGVEKGNWRLMR